MFVTIAILISIKIKKKQKTINNKKYIYLKVEPLMEK